MFDNLMRNAKAWMANCVRVLIWLAVIGALLQSQQVTRGFAPRAIAAFGSALDSVPLVHIR
jgi:hypothetical protein